MVAGEGYYDGVAGRAMFPEFLHKFFAFREKAACYSMTIDYGFTAFFIVLADREIARGFPVVEAEGEYRLSLHAWIVTKMPAMGCRIVDIKLKYSNFTHHAPYRFQRVQC